MPYRAHLPTLLALALATSGCPGRLVEPERFERGVVRACPDDFDVEQDLFGETCGTTGCHAGGAEAASGLDLAAPDVGARLLAHRSTSTVDACRGRALLTPGDLAGSLLVEKLADEPPCGAQMPVGLGGLTSVERVCLEEYLTALMGGAPLDGGTPPVETDAGVAPPDGGAPDAGALDAGAPAPLVPHTYEAEATMTLDGYVVDAVDPTVIRLPPGVASGTATVGFDGGAGLYSIVVRVVAENDGFPRLALRVDGDLVFDETFPEGPADVALGPYAVTLREGSVLVLEGTADAGAYARIDALEVTP